MAKPITRPQLEEFWFHEYTDGFFCTLCGNSGTIDTRTATLANGKRVGRLNYCFCPNGRVAKQHRMKLRPSHLRRVAS